MHTFVRLAALSVALPIVAASATAFADPPVTRGQFTDHVVGGHPVGDATALHGARTAVYFLELDNHSGAEIHLTVVWSLDGHEAHRQDVVTHGRSTWVFQPLHHAHQVSVSVLDAAGHQVHADSATL